MVSNGKKTKPRQARSKYGSVRQLPSGRWQARLSKHFDPKGRPIPGTFATREDAELAVFRAYEALRSGALQIPDDEADDAPATPAQAPLTVRDAMDALICEHRDLAAKTVSGCRSLSKVIICHPKYGIGDVRLEALTVPALLEWKTKLEAVPVTASNIVAAFRVLSSALSWAVSRGRLSDNCVLRMPQRSTKKTRAAKAERKRRLPSWEEMWAFVDAIPDETHRLMVLLLAFTGIRFAELAALEPSSLIHATHELNLTHVWVKPKGEPWVMEPLKGGLARTVYVPDGLWELLVKYVDTWQPQSPPRKPFLFPSPASKSRRGIGIWQAAPFADDVINPARERAGLDVRTKDLRAFAASALVDAGATTVEVKAVLGHADQQTTERHYLTVQSRQAHDPVRMAIRMDRSLSVNARLDALWAEFMA